jgi:hypothetical protein
MGAGKSGTKIARHPIDFGRWNPCVCGLLAFQWKELSRGLRRNARALAIRSGQVAVLSQAGICLLPLRSASEVPQKCLRSASAAGARRLGGGEPRGRLLTVPQARPHAAGARRGARRAGSEAGRPGPRAAPHGAPLTPHPPAGVAPRPAEERRQKAHLAPFRAKWAFCRVCMWPPGLAGPPSWGGWAAEACAFPGKPRDR